MSSPDTHPCEIPGCARRVRNGYLMCLSHWRLVPTDLQRDVYSTLRRYTHGNNRVTIAAALRAYRTTVAKAVAAVQQIEGSLPEAQQPATHGKDNP